MWGPFLRDPGLCWMIAKSVMEFFFRSTFLLQRSSAILFQRCLLDWSEVPIIIYHLHSLCWQDGTMWKEATKKSAWTATIFRYVAVSRWHYQSLVFQLETAMKVGIFIVSHWRILNYFGDHLILPCVIKYLLLIAIIMPMYLCCLNAFGDPRPFH